eukprot:s4920_g5.t2
MIDSYGMKHLKPYRSTESWWTVRRWAVPFTSPPGSFRMAGHADLTVAAADLTVVRLVMSDVGDGRPLVGGLIVTFSPPADDGESDDGELAQVMTIMSSTPLVSGSEENVAISAGHGSAP